MTDAGQLEAYAVSTDVNRVQNNDPHLLDPIRGARGPEP